MLITFTVVTILEHNFYFGTTGRKVLWYSFIGISVAALIGWVAVPLAKLFRLGKRISHNQAAAIIGSHFANVKDKLLNILQLKDQADQAPNAELLLASINQKSEEIKLVPFRSAIDLSENRKNLRYALPPLLLLLGLLFAAPSLIKDSTNRLVNNGTDFERPAPFHFDIDDTERRVVQFEDYPLTVKVDGEVLPNEVFIDVDNYQYRLTKVDQNTFTYRFNNVAKDTEFKLFSGDVESKDYDLTVLKKPNIAGFEVKLDYPGYTGRRDETLNSVGDLVVPTGTKIDWVFNSLNTDDISIEFSGSDEPVAATRFADDLFTHQKRLLRDERYKLIVGNRDLPRADSVAYGISVIPDRYPTIEVEQFQDSVETKLFYFVGEAGDDYGLRSLTFNYRVTDERGVQGALQSTPIDKTAGKQTRYNHLWDLNELALEPGTELTYYFEVFDNDGVNGSKSARTNVMVFATPTVEEFEEQEQQNNEEIKDKLKKTIEDSKDLQKDMKKLREDLLQKEEVDWQTKKEMEKMMQRQQDLQKDINEAKQAFEENMKNQEEFTKTDERIQEKQEKIQELFEEALSDEMKEMMEEIQKLMEELEKDGALEMMEEMEMDDEELEMELDRMMELFKQLEVEAEMERAIEKLEELAEEQEKLAEETEEFSEKEDEMSEQEKEAKQEELKEKQEELSDEFEKLEEQMEKTKEKNEELERPKDLGDQSEESEEIKEDQQQSEEQMEQQQNKKASEKQKSAAQKMQQMAGQMQQQMQQQQQEQAEEDMESLRQLLENLVGLSFAQEDLMDQFDITNPNTPRYVGLVQEQFKIKDDFRLVEDSLQALAKRVFQIESFVTEKVTDIKGDLKQTMKDLENRQKPQAAEHQQRTMKSLNDLALMLNEVMEQMQQQMASAMPGSQSCEKPGGKGKGGKPSDKISEGQGKLNEQMKKMQDGMKGGEGGSSKEFAEMAARQAALRKALQQKQKELQEQGQGKSGQQLQDMIDQMDKIETDLVNKQLTNEMMKRQEDILGRLLEHEKAEREREFDNKRKAETADQYERKYPPALEEYLKKRQAEVDMFKSVSPALRPYYKSLVEEYYNSLR